VSKLTSNEQYVLQVIKDNPGVQDEEMKLLEAVWLKQGYDETKSLYWNLTRVMHAETVARARRKLHEYGLIEYSPTALRRRTKRYKAEIERHSGGSVTEKIVYGHNPIVGRVKLVTREDGERVVILG